MLRELKEEVAPVDCLIDWLIDWLIDNLFIVFIFQHAEGVEGGYTDVAPVDCWSERESSDEEQPRDESSPAEVFNDENPRLHPGSAVCLHVKESVREK